MMAHVDLCSGIGGFALGFEWAGLSKPVLFCDIEPWSRKVLAKHWPDVPIAEDVKELANDPARLVPDCDILSCGYPCQPFSVAGRQRGTEDDRHIWPEIFKIIQAKRPTWIVCENVPGHISLGLDEVLSDLEDKAGYAVQTFCVGAVALNAPHRRQRIFVIAHTNRHGEPNGTINEKQGCGKLVGNTSSGRRSGNDRRRSGQELANRCEDVADTQSLQCNERQHEISKEKAGEKGVRGKAGASGQDVADTTSQRQQRQGPSRDASNSAQRGEGQATEFVNGGFGDKRQFESRICHLADGLPKGLDRFDGWEREPEDIPRVATGVKDRVSRLKGLGNAIVPSIAMRIGMTIKAVHDD